MRIGGSAIPALPAPVGNRREDIAERPERQPQAAPTPAEPVAEREVTRIRTRASASAQKSAAEPASSFGATLSKQIRGALQSYASNGPSIEERLGVELAGIDVYA